MSCLQVLMWMFSRTQSCSWQPCSVHLSWQQLAGNMSDHSDGDKNPQHCKSLWTESMTRLNTPPVPLYSAIFSAMKLSITGWSFLLSNIQRIRDKQNVKMTKVKIKKPEIIFFNCLIHKYNLYQREVNKREDKPQYSPASSVGVLLWTGL